LFVSLPFNKNDGRTADIGTLGARRFLNIASTGAKKHWAVVETVPITVKASHELAQTLVNELRKGVAFVVEGQLALLQESRNEPGVLFDLGRESHRDHPAEIHRGESRLSL
jgi:hypothetical protein